MSSQLEAAVEAAVAAGLYLKRTFGNRSLRVDRKGRNDFVTSADRKAERTILSILKKRFPADSFLAEESGFDSAQAGRVWVIDPLDGTANFVFGYPQFCVSIALLESGRPVIGVVYDPLREDLFTARRGGGARLNGRRIRVARSPGLSEALVATGFPFRSHRQIDVYLACFRAIFLASAGVRRDGSAALNICYVAAGRFGGFWESGLMPWDIAAGALLVEEAGGTLSDFAGGDDHILGGDVVAASPGVHPEILSILDSILKGVRPKREDLLDKQG
jgi:myo-inositol-1(or 4)-monophosphatase